MQFSSQCPDPPYVPQNLLTPEAFATFNKELVNAVTCCEAVEQNPWTALMAQAVLRKAGLNNGKVTVKAVSQPSEPSCTQRFMVFEAKEDGHTTYIIALRSDPQCFDDIVSTRAALKAVNSGNKFQVHKSMWWRAATMPLQSLPPQWRRGLRDHGDRLILTGFSVGGAVAALATFLLLDGDRELKDRGDQYYANRINDLYLKNFYHVMIDGDPIPGVLTLVSKVAENQPDVCRDVVTSICKMLAVATGVLLNSALPEAGAIAGAVAGAIANQIDFAKLGSGIKSLIVTEENSRMSLPEYKFGGSLVLLNSRQPSDQMEFVRLRGDGRVLENVFCVQERNVTTSGLQNARDSLTEFCRVINDLDNSNLTQAITNALGVPHHSDKAPREFSQIVEHSLDHIGEVLKDGAGRVAKSSVSVAMSAARCVISPNVEEDHQASTSCYSLLEPQFDEKKPIHIWLDKHGNITIKVYGVNMAFGIHVLYLQNGKEKLRIPCTEEPQGVENSEHPHKRNMERPFANNIPLHFSIQGFKGLSTKELLSGGCFEVHLAFGTLKDVPVSENIISLFDALNVLKVAERFSTEQPAKLIDLLLFWGMATAQAQCTAAFYTIQKNPRDAKATADKTLNELLKVPQEIILLDDLLALLDTSQFPISVLNELPPEMSRMLRYTLNIAAESNIILPYFTAGNELSADWTFRGRYTRTVKRMITEEMLSKKETAEQLSKSLDEELTAPKKMILAFFDRRFECKAYGEEFSIKHIEKWKREKKIVGNIIHFPINCAEEAWEDADPMLGLIGVPIAAFMAGFAGAAWGLFHGVSVPIRMHGNRPGLVNDWLRRKISAESWGKKLQAAASLFHCKMEPPHVACKLEYELYQSLKIPETGCFNSSTVKDFVTKSRYTAATTVQLANIGVAGARVYEFRRRLTARETALGLIGSSKAGKSTFASLAFKVDSHPGAGQDHRTRVLRHWSLDLTHRKNRKFTLIDFPGSTDHAAKNWYIRGQLLARVMVVVLSLKEISSVQAVTLVEKACKARRTDEQVHFLFCFTHADQEYETYEDEEEEGENTNAAQLFTQNFERYKKELLDAASDGAGDAADQLTDIGSHMHPCCFKPRLQGETEPLARKLKEVGVKNVQWVKDWCLPKM